MVRFCEMEGHAMTDQDQKAYEAMIQEMIRKGRNN